jgi:regulator of protease activity HflC (stomatin/prohibitin superfamily)
LRLGKYLGIKGPGIIWKTPILDKIALKVSLREQESEVDTGRYDSSGGSSQRLKGVILWRVIDVERYALSIEDHQRTVNNTIQHHVHKVAESMTGDVAFSDTDKLAMQIEEALKPTFTAWGLRITKVDLRTASE